MTMELGIEKESTLRNTFKPKFKLPVEIIKNVNSIISAIMELKEQIKECMLFYNLGETKHCHASLLLWVSII